MPQYLKPQPPPIRTPAWEAGWGEGVFLEGTTAKEREASASKWWDKEQARIILKYEDVADWTQKGWQQRRQENPERVEQWKNEWASTFQKYKELKPTTGEMLAGSPMGRAFYPEVEEGTQVAPSLTWLNRVKELSDTPGELIPFIGSSMEIGYISDLLRTANAIEAGETVNRRELLALKQYVDRANADKSWGYKVADVVTNLIPWGLEFLLTSGIYTAGKTATVKVAIAALRKYTTKSGAKLLNKALVKYGIKTAGVVAGGTLRAVPLAIAGAPAMTLEKQLQKTLVGDEEVVWLSAVKSLGEVWVETVSESLGGIVTSPIKGALVKLGLFNAFMKANPAKSAGDIRRIVDKIGYNGVFGEMLEERLADVGHGILYKLGLGDQKFSFPSLEQLSIEMVAFSIPGVAMKVAESTMPELAEGVTPEVAPTESVGVVVEPTAKPEVEELKKANPMLFRRADKASNVEDFINSVIKADKTTKDKVSIPALTSFFNRVKGVTPEVTPETASKTIEVLATEETAVTEITGKPPKPPKDWDKIGAKLYDSFKKQVSEPTPSTVPLSDRILRAWGQLEKFTTDELARLNWLGWQTEVDTAMVRATPGQASQLYRETMKSVAKSLGNNSNLLSYVDDYLILRHQLEVLKATGRKYFTVKKGDKTLRFTAKQIGLLFDQMKKELGTANYAKVKEASSHVPAVYNQTLRETQELTPEQIEGIIKKYPWFNPILFEKETVPINIDKKMSQRQIKQLTVLESDKQQITPLMSLPTIISKRLQAFAINDARKSISEAAVDPKNARLIGGEVEIVTKKPEGASIDYFDNGIKKYLKLGKGVEWLAKDIELLQTQPANMLINFVRGVQNLSKMAFTTYNPGFMVWNTAFDGMVSYFAEGISPWGFGKALAQNIKSLFVDVPSMSEFRRAGGEMMGFFGKGKEVEKFIGKKKGRIALKNPESLKRFANPFEIIRELGLSGENAARKATFDKALKEGLSEKEAALRARRVTVDFSRFSTASRIINDWFIYFNPAVQGFLVPGRAIAKNPRALWRLAALVSFYSALVIYNQSYDEYADVPDNDKVGKLLIMLPSDEYNKYGQKKPHYITLLPLREFALFTASVEYLLGKLMTDEPEAYRTIAQEMGVVFRLISPLSMISETGGFVLPTQVLSTIQQIIQNHDDYRNKPIVDDEMALLPAAQQYDQYTDKLAIKIGQALNISPKKLDFFVSNMFGAMGRDALRSLDLAIQGLDKETVDERIAGLVNDLRNIASTVPPSQITLTRETFLEGLSVEDRELVLNMERMPDDQIPFITSIFKRFFRDYGGQVYRTAKEKALANRNLEDYPPEALEKLQKEAVQNAENLIAEKITHYQFDQQRTKYRSFYSGGSTAEWREAMIEGAVSKADVDKYMPEAYQRSGEFQAVSAYMEIRQKHIDKAGGVFDADTWDEIVKATLNEMKQFYSEAEIKYAIAHKDDWIDKLPEPARTIERERARAIEDETWWDDYRGAVPMSLPTRQRRETSQMPDLTHMFK